MELAVLRSLVSDRRSGVIGSPPPSDLPISEGSESLLDRRPPPLAKRVHPPVNATSPSEFSGPSPPATSRPQAPSLGSRPHRDISRKSPRSRASHGPLRSVHGVSHSLDGLLLPRPRGFVSPRSHVRDSPFRVFPPRAADASRRRIVPSCRSTARATVDLRRQRHARSPAFRALFHAGVRCATQGVSPRVTRSPPGFRLLRVLRSLAV
jgi:hypothetical protein